MEESLEPFDTFEENAASKARYFARLSGLPTVADDSGIEVDALGGRPGVRTKRFAPPGRYPHLSRDEAQQQVPAGPPRACAARAARGPGTSAWPPSSIRPAEGTARFRGEAPGRILREGRGTGGFGYDPIFHDDELRRTFAELTEAEKNARSHRGRAFRQFARFLAGRS